MSVPVKLIVLQGQSVDADDVSQSLATRTDAILRLQESLSEIPSPGVSADRSIQERAILQKLTAQLEAASTEIALRDSEIRRLRTALEEAHGFLRKKSLGDIASATSSPRGSPRGSPRSPSVRMMSPLTLTEGAVPLESLEKAQSVIAQLERRVQLMDQQMKKDEKLHQQQVSFLNKSLCTLP